MAQTPALQAVEQVAARRDAGAIKSVVQRLGLQLEFNLTSTGQAHIPVHSVKAKLTGADGGTIEAEASASTVTSAKNLALVRLAHDPQWLQLAQAVASALAPPKEKEKEKQPAPEAGAAPEGGGGGAGGGETVVIAQPVVDHKGKLMMIMSRARACARNMPGFDPEFFVPCISARMQGTMFVGEVTVRLPGDETVATHGVGQRKKRAEQEAALMCLQHPLMEPWVRGFGENWGARERSSALPSEVSALVDALRRAGKQSGKKRARSPSPAGGAAPAAAAAAEQQGLAVPVTPALAGGRLATPSKDGTPPVTTATPAEGAPPGEGHAVRGPQPEDRAPAGEEEAMATGGEGPLGTASGTGLAAEREGRGVAERAAGAEVEGGAGSVGEDVGGEMAQAPAGMVAALVALEDLAVDAMQRGMGGVGGGGGSALQQGGEERGDTAAVDLAAL